MGSVCTVLGTLFTCITMVIAAAAYWDSHPAVQDRVTPYLDWGWEHWWLVPVVILVGIVIALAAWFRDYARWAPGGVVSWVRWRHLDGHLRVKLAGLSTHAKELAVIAVRVGKEWQGGRLSIEMYEMVTFLNSRLRGQKVTEYSSDMMEDGFGELREAGLLTFVRQDIGTCLVKFSPKYGSGERLADLLEMRLVAKRQWKP